MPRNMVLVGALALASCGHATSVATVQQAFAAAAGNDAEAFASVVAPAATITLMKADPHPLKLADLRVSPDCPLTEFGEVRADIVFASGSCDLKTPYGDNVPIYFQAYLRDGKIVRVDRMVFPL